MLSPVRPSVRLSVCPSVTRVDQSKTVEVRIMQPSPHSTPMTPISWRLTSPGNSKGNIGSWAPNKRGVWIIRNFQPISCRISETVYSAYFDWEWRQRLSRQRCSRRVVYRYGSWHHWLFSWTTTTPSRRRFGPELPDNHKYIPSNSVTCRFF